ncbi:MAG: hypothetical protein HFI37_05015 [Lachnospiraceae bacterium]|nr:hypothetical protein [Lachnospiraceae bacterium]
MNEKKGMRFHLIFWLGTLCLLFFDRLSKYFAVLYLKDKPSIPVIQDIFCLQYLENRGAAFGLLQGKKLIFILITLIFFIVVFWIYTHLSLKKRFYPIYFIMILFFSGASGNFLAASLQR